MSDTFFFGELASLGTAACWALAVSLFREPIARYGARAVNLAKNALAACLLGVTVLVLGQVDALAAAPAQALGLIALSGWLGLTVGDTALFVAVSRIGVHRALLLQSLTPVFTALFVRWAGGAPLQSMETIGAAVVCLGIAIVVWPRRRESGDWFDRVGIAAGVVAALGQAGGIVLAKEAMTTLPLVAASLVRMVAATLGVVLLLAFGGALRRTARAITQPPAMRAIVPAAVIGTYLAFLLMMAGIAWTPAPVAAVLFGTSPIFGLIVGVWLEGTPVTLRGFLGSAVSVVGIAILTLAATGSW